MARSPEVIDVTFMQISNVMHNFMQNTAWLVLDVVIRFGVGFVSLFFVFVSKNGKRKSHEVFKGISRRGDKELPIA